MAQTRQASTASSMADLAQDMEAFALIATEYNADLQVLMSNFAQAQAKLSDRFDKESDSWADERDRRWSNWREIVSGWALRNKGKE